MPDSNDAAQKPKTITIRFGKEKFEVTQSEMTGAELRRLFSVPQVDDLYRARGSKVEGDPIGDNQLVELHNGDDFTSSPKASGGNC